MVDLRTDEGDQADGKTEGTAGGDDHITIKTDRKVTEFVQQ